MDPSVSPPSGVEQTPVAPKPTEQAPTAAPESAPAKSAPERRESSAEQAPQPSQGVSLPPVQPPATPVAPAAPVQPATTDDGTTPVIADDVDVIEMEWVNQAKKVIKETKDDPHAQEAAVEKLQKEYLKKRFGREIKSSSA